VFLPKAKNNR